MQVRMAHALRYIACAFRWIPNDEELHMAQRNRTAPPATRRRTSRGKHAKAGKTAKSSGTRSKRKTSQGKSAKVAAPPLRAPLYAMPMRADVGVFGDRRALEAAYRAFARMSRPKSRNLH
jgi:hypothetical protein